MRCIASEVGSKEPVALADLKVFMRITTGDIEDAALRLMLQAARKSCEEFARISIVKRQWKAYFKPPQARGNELVSNFTVHDPDNIREKIIMPRKPIVSVDQVNVLTKDGSTYDTPAYVLEPTTKDIIWETCWLPPAVVYSLEVVFTAGYPTNNESNPSAATKTVCPDDIGLAINETVSHFYENRGTSDKIVLPERAKELLRGYWSSRSYM